MQSPGAATGCGTWSVWLSECRISPRAEPASEVPDALRWGTRMDNLVGSSGSPGTSLRQTGVRGLSGLGRGLKTASCEQGDCRSEATPPGCVRRRRSGVCTVLPGECGRLGVLPSQMGSRPRCRTARLLRLTLTASMCWSRASYCAATMSPSCSPRPWLDGARCESCECAANRHCWCQPRGLAITSCTDCRSSSGVGPSAGTCSFLPASMRLTGNRGGAGC